ncbi:MAG TPA: ABC transporter ATP-binding protein [Chloroflexi bacterium]|nr:ABC transporter ATP-binding protein [Chloroflexota bacterium]
MLSIQLHKRLSSFDLSLDLSAPPGVTALFGPSGAGKSMTLTCIAGLAKPDAGRIALDGLTFFDSAARIDLPPQRRRIGYVMQDYLLFPHLTVGENVAFGLSRLSRLERQRTVTAMLERVGLAGYAHRRPDELSGGQQQRVALARALVTQPRALLLDEPFSALDAPTRALLRRDLLDLQRSLQLPVIFITHDFGEAYLLADQLAVLVEGRLLQRGAPAEVVAHPLSQEVARLTGSRNFLPAEVVAREEDALMVRAGELLLAAPPAPHVSPGATFTLAIRPERIMLVRKDAQTPARRNTVHGVIVDELSDGFTCTLFLRADAGQRLRPDAMFDLEIVVPVYIYERLHIAEERHWAVILPQEALQVLR